MIRNIFLHIGVHKTASTTIQNTLYAARLKLSEAGVLYPRFKAGSIAISNHSIPFYSLFCKGPGQYHFNVSHGFTSSAAIHELHAEYRQQLKAELANFHGETLIISGEDISLLARKELENLQTWLTNITIPEVNIRVVMMCRHPVSRFRSAVNSSVCNFGMPLENAIHYHLRTMHNYRNKIQVFSAVFGRDHMTVLKYEDAVNHPYGPAGALLAIVDNDFTDKIKQHLLHNNQARAYESFVLLNAVNQTCYHTSDEELQPERMVELNQFFNAMPGQKFMLQKGLSTRAWQFLAEDVNWLCSEFSLQPYIFSDEDMLETSEIWSNKTLDYLKSVFPDFSDFHKKVFLGALLNELREKRKNFTLDKAQKIFEFVLFYSKYLQVGSRIAKFRYFSRVVGVTRTLKFSLHYIVH